MQVRGKSGVGFACIALLVLAAMPTGDATHGGSIHVSNLVPFDKGLRLGSQAQTLSFDVTNGHATVVAEQIVVSLTGDERVTLLGATVGVTGWTAAVSDADNDGNADRVTLTGTMAAGATLRVTVQLRVLSTTTESHTQDLSVSVIDTTPNPDVILGTDAITDLTFHRSLIRTVPSIVIIGEGQSGEVVNVRLAEDPGPGSVTVTVGTGDASIAAASPGTLTFTGDDAGDPNDPDDDVDGTWDEPQQVTLTATSTDQVDSGTIQTSLDLRYGQLPLAAGATVPVFVQDDDEAGILIEETGDGTIVFEGSDTDTFMVSLATQPTATVEVRLSVAAPNQATLDRSTLSFDGSDWQTGKPVRVTAVNDATAEQLVTTTAIQASVTSSTSRDDGYGDVDPQVITLSVVDNEGVNVIVEQSDQFTLVTEALGNRSDDFTVVLAREPLRNVVVDIKLNAASKDDLSVLPTSLTFTPTNWLVPQQVVVTAVDDALGEGTEIASVDVEVNRGTSSAEYKSVPKKTVSATVSDNDVRGFVPVITSTNKRTSESVANGANDVVVGVKLNLRPDGPVGLAVASTDTGEIIVLSGASLSFTPQNWDTVQTVVLRGVNDDVRDGHQDVNVTFSVTQTSHPLWRTLPVFNLTVVNRDDEYTVAMRPETLTLDEGETGSYQISLTRPPATGHTVKVVVTPPAGLRVSSPTAVPEVDNTTGRLLLSFSAADAPQTVRVEAVDDQAAAGDGESHITHAATSSDPNYHNIPVANVTVTVTDDERFDLQAANRALQDTVRVERRGGDNIVSWDISAVPGEPSGVQVWRSSSPFTIIATLDDATSEFRDEEYRDRGGGRNDIYIVTAFFGPSQDEGRFPSNTPLSLVPGYLGMSLAQQQETGTPVADDAGLSTGAWIAIVAGAFVLLIILVVIIVLAARRKQQDEEPEWDAPAEAWQVAPTPAATGAEETFHVTCPRCGNDFDAVGHKPIVTHCPHCGVEGVLR